MGPQPSPSKPCPYSSPLYQVVQAADMVHRFLSMGLVSSKHQGDPIKTTPLLTAVKHLDLARADFSGAAELRAGSNSERRKALSTDGSNDIWDILPHTTKRTILNLGLHTEFLRPSEEDALMTVTGSVVRMSVEFRSSVCRFLLLEDSHRLLINQECYLLLHKYLICLQ